MGTSPTMIDRHHVHVAKDVGQRMWPALARAGEVAGQPALMALSNRIPACRVV